MAGNSISDSQFQINGISASISSLESSMSAAAARLSDSMKGHSALLESSAARLGDSMKALNAAGLGDSMKRLSASLASLGSMSAAARLGDSMKEFGSVGVGDHIGRASASVASLESLMSATAARLGDSMKGHSALLESSAARLGDSMKALNAAGLGDSMKGLSASLASLGSMSDLRFDNILDRISKEKWPLAYETISNDIIINSDSSLSVDSTTVSYEEIENLVNQIVDNAFDRTNKNLEEAVAKIVSAIQGVRTPALEKILAWIIFPIIVGLVFSISNPIADFHIKEYLAPNKKVIDKPIQVQNGGSILTNAQQLSSFRSVSAAELNIRSMPSNKAPILGKLRFGQVVVLIENDKSWSRVAWSDDEKGLKLQGWVFSRYLQKFL